MNIRPALLAIALTLTPLLAGATEKKVVVHEWGTFTSLQDEAGEAIGGINTDDEPVPEFVHRLVGDGYGFGFFLRRTEAPPVFFQGTPRCHPDVTMRLETPVLYFYPPEGGFTQPFDVRVQFRGGWLTEFFPNAEARAPGFDGANPDRVWRPAASPGSLFQKGFGTLQPDAVGELSWQGVTCNADGVGPQTDEKVWLAPRAVQSAMLKTAYGEREKFLFYRGVGNVHAGLRVVRDEAHHSLDILDEPSISAVRPINPKISAAWLVEVLPDGRCAFRSLGTLPTAAEPRATVPASFAPEDFTADHMPRLQEEMRAALIASGLFADEAEAFLRTWQISYFQSRGLRLFYLCPAAEIDRLLPLQISVPCDITRVMIGRIEIVTPGQRALLAKIAAGPALELWTMRGPTGDSQSSFFQNPENMRHWNEVMAGNAPYRELGLPIPPIYDAYLQLGRFRNALLLDEEKRRPTEALHEYIKKNEFGAYHPRGGD